MFCSAIVLATRAAVAPLDAVAVILTTFDSAADRAVASATAAPAPAPSFDSSCLTARALTCSDRTSASRSGAEFGVGVPTARPVGASGASRNSRLADALYVASCRLEYR